MLEPLNTLLAASNPHFVNRAEAGGDIIPLRHITFPPASAIAVAALEDASQGSDTVLPALYRESDGLQLFANRADPGECFFFLPLAQMAAEKTMLYEWLLTDDENCEDGDAVYGVPTWWDSTIVFAGFGQAPERFYLATAGAHRGKVFYFNHEECSMRIADSVADFLDLLCTDPVTFMQRFYDVAYWDIAAYHPA